jgi:hypothetical protein
MAKAKDKKKNKRRAEAAHREATKAAYLRSAAVAALGVSRSERKPPLSTARPASESRAVSDTRPLTGGRITQDAGLDSFSRLSVIVAPPDAESAWRSMSLDDRTLDRLPVSTLIKYLCNLSPDISKAVWDYQRLINPGYEILVTKPGSETEDKKAKATLDLFLDFLKDEYGGFDVVINRMSIAAYLRGAVLAELVLDKAGKKPVDFVTPDPAIIRFKRKEDPERGYKWVMGQYQKGHFVAFERPTVRYVAIDPFPDEPYGRPPVGPALFSTLFLLGLLHDLRRVVSQQGYPRIDISLALNKLREAMPPDLEGDAKAVKEWVDGALNEVREIYKNLQPDEAYVHLDTVDIKRPVGTVDSDSLGAVDDLLKALERMSVRALKTMPLMMGSADASNETNANRQWEIFIAGIKSLQHLIEGVIERLLGLALEAQGVAAVVSFRFAEARASEEMRDAQTEGLKIANERQKYAMGWTTQDEAAETITGHKAAEPKPRVNIDAKGSPTPAVEVEGGERILFRLRTKKGVIRIEGSREVETITPSGADAGVSPVPPTVEITDSEFSRYIREWEKEQGDVYEGLLDAELVEG